MQGHARQQTEESDSLAHDLGLESGHAGGRTHFFSKQ